MDTKIFDGSYNPLIEENNNVDKYINTKSSINNNILFYFILIVVMLLTSYCGYNIINVFITCKENFIIKYIKLFIVIAFIYSIIFIIPTYTQENNTNTQEGIKNGNDRKKNG